MKSKHFILTVSILMLAGLTAVPAQAQDWISDIQANPSRYWNRTVTVIGDVLTVQANPQGTTRGFYVIQDDSNAQLTVQTKDLPPIGRTFKVEGVIMQDPNNANAPLMRELKRNTPGLSSNMKILLIGGGALFLVLLIIFIVLLAKPKTAAAPPAPAATVRPTPRPTPPPPPAPTVGPDLTKTTKIPSAAAAAPAAAPTPDKTQVFMSLGADVVAEKGPDKGKEFTLHKQVTLIGRAGARKNDIEVSDETVSKEQASIYYDSTSKQFTMKNESQTNVTLVNGKMATDPVILNDGDLIEMGRSILKFRKA